MDDFYKTDQQEPVSLTDQPAKRKPGRPRKNPLPTTNPDVETVTAEPETRTRQRRGKMLSNKAAYDLLYPILTTANGTFATYTDVGKIPGIALSDDEVKKECELLCEIPAIRLALSKADNPYLKLLAFNAVIVWQRIKLVREMKAMVDSLTPEQQQAMKDMANNYAKYQEQTAQAG